MDDLYSRIVRDRGSLERLLARMPGFRGYKEMSARREADTLMRQHVAGRLKQVLERLASIEKIILDGGGLAFMSQTRSVKTKFQTFIDRIATDAPGYSGFYDAVKIGPEDLQVIYAFDEALLEYGDRFNEKLDELEQAVLKGEGIAEAIRELDALAIEANRAYDLRDDVLKGLE